MRGSPHCAPMLTILFDGVAYGMLLFVLASGLSVTLGLMNFINLAHGAFAMVGGYVTALTMQRLGAPFLGTLPAAFLVAEARAGRIRAVNVGKGAKEFWRFAKDALAR